MMGILIGEVIIFILAFSLGVIASDSDIGKFIKKIWSDIKPKGE